MRRKLSAETAECMSPRWLHIYGLSWQSSKPGLHSQLRYVLNSTHPCCSLLLHLPQTQQLGECTGEKVLSLCHCPLALQPTTANYIIHSPFFPPFNFIQNSYPLYFTHKLPCAREIVFFFTSHTASAEKMLGLANVGTVCCFSLAVGIRSQSSLCWSYCLITRTPSNP